MPFVQVGHEFPDFAAQGVDTAKLRSSGPLFVVIWRTGCSTCCYAMPFYQRLADANPKAAVVGICQDDGQTTTAYCQENGIKFPQVADEDDGLAVTGLFKPETVPCYYLTDADGKVLVGGEAWNADDLNEISARMASAAGAEAGALVPETEDVPRFKPG